MGAPTGEVDDARDDGGIDIECREPNKEENRRPRDEGERFELGGVDTDLCAGVWVASLTAVLREVEGVTVEGKSLSIVSGDETKCSAPVTMRGVRADLDGLSENPANRPLLLSLSLAALPCALSFIFPFRETPPVVALRPTGFPTSSKISPNSSTLPTSA